MGYKDQHLHYTGSLPVRFVWKKIKECQGSLIDVELLDELFSDEVIEGIKSKDYSDETCHLFKKDIKMLFRDKKNYVRNYDSFFKLYKFIQNITKPRSDKDIEPSYKEGVNAIISALSKSEVSNFDIFAGPLLDPDITKSRLLGMIQGIKDNRHLRIEGSIRLTFINTNSGYKNLSKSSLVQLLELISNNGEIASHISGFDFSGNENVDNIDVISSTVKKLAGFSKKVFAQKGKSLKISVHAGEDFINISPESYLSYFDKLLDLPINSIGHGIFLWIPNELVNYSEKIDKLRGQLLEKLVKNKVELEICPTSNVTFSPLMSYKDIPIDLFDKIGLKYSINTDNMAVLSTNIEMENERVMS
jgi:hypothetical protein